MNQYEAGRWVWATLLAEVGREVQERLQRSIDNWKLRTTHKQVSEKQSLTKRSACYIKLTVRRTWQFWSRTKITLKPILAFHRIYYNREKNNIRYTDENKFSYIRHREMRACESLARPTQTWESKRNACWIFQIYLLLLRKILLEKRPQLKYYLYVLLQAFFAILGSVKCTSRSKILHCFITACEMCLCKLYSKSDFLSK